MNWRTTAEKTTEPATEVNAVPVKTARLTNKYYLYLCGACGEAVSVTNNFCAHCGSRLNWANEDE